MSASLLAEFDSFYNKTDDSNQQTARIARDGQQGDARSQIDQSDAFTGGHRGNDSSNPWLQDQPMVHQNDKPASTEVDLDDDWGDFESGQPSETLQTDTVGNTFNDRISPEEAEATRKLKAFDIGGDEFNAISHSVAQELSQGQRISDKAPRDENVLFDVDDELDDEFGEFETAEQSSPGRFDQRSTGTTSGSNAGTLIDLDIENEQLNSSARPLASQQDTSQKYPFDALGEIKFDERSFEDSDFGSRLQLQQQSGDIAASMQPTQLVTEQIDSVVVSPWYANENDSLNDDITPEPSHRIEKDLHLSQSQSVSQWDYDEPNARGQEDTSFASKPAEDEAWDNFEEETPEEKIPATKVSSEHKKTSVHSSNTASQVDANVPKLQLLPILQRQSQKASPAPPTNVPPPALLFPLFTPIFELVRTSLYEPIGELADDSETRRDILSQEKTKDFLHSYLAIATVLAHIVAGRKLRWKRDTILSQSMRIGPASSGKSSGMKLTGIDKGESLREDREVEDTVRFWRAQVGRLRTVISGAGVTIPVPEVSETLPIRLAQSSEGAISAPKPCALCALKRNERVPKVDVDVQDSFGEFWIEHWGHTNCVDFWYSYEQMLASR